MRSQRSICLLFLCILVISQWAASIHVTSHASRGSAPHASALPADALSKFTPDAAHHAAHAATPAHAAEHVAKHAAKHGEEEVFCLSYHLLLSAPACLTGSAQIPGCTWLGLQRDEQQAVTWLLAVSTEPPIRGPPSISS